MSWASELAGPSGDPAVVRRVVALAASGGAGPERQRRSVLARLERDGLVEPHAVLADLERAMAGRLGDRATDRAGRRLAELGARLRFLGDRDYPDRLAQLWPELGAPLWLFTVSAGGAMPTGPAVAVVGSRHPSLDGVDLATSLGRLLARNGAVVVSGLARGIDEAAHVGAMEGGGPTVAVLGTGFGVDYPYRRGPLRARIAASGALVTELAPDTPPKAHQFLWRNRIIAGLADAVVVVEGRARSGALATARLGAEQGREVWAVPGSPNQPTARAPLDLIRDGARPLTRLDDVLEGLSGLDRVRFGRRASGPDEHPAADAPERTEPSAPPGAPAVPDGPLHAVAAALSAVPASAGALHAATGLPLPELLATLAALTAEGHARTTPRGWVAGGRP